jgi:hypothetical protein
MELRVFYGHEIIFKIKASANQSRIPMFHAYTDLLMNLKPFTTISQMRRKKGGALEMQELTCN